MTDYTALVREGRKRPNPGDVTSPRWAGGGGELRARLADAVQALAVERDALRAQLDGTCSHPFSRLKFDGGHRALVCNTCDRVVTHMAVEEGDDQ